MNAQSEYDELWGVFLPLLFDKISRNIRIDMSKELEEYGLSSMHAPYLMALNIKNGQTLMSLSHFLDMDRSNSCRVIRELEDKGMVYDLRRSPTSKNYPLFLTHRGELISNKLMDVMYSLVSRYFEGISEDEYKKMKNTLIRLFENISTEGYSSPTWRMDPYYEYMIESQNTRLTGKRSIMEGNKDHSYIESFNSNDINL
ncbi:MAG: winged helix-turn-helix transcriptional regulator [Thermoplasmata archaeon]|nr:winged helix-turn-helix transcriptional regulator [Thermoplasmata archaeon]